MEKLFEIIPEIRGLICNKSVAIVGNAQSIYSKKNGAKIDSHEVVIRFNRGFISDKEAQGSRTDILFLACELTPEELAQFNAKYTINRSSRTKCGMITLNDDWRKWYRKRFDNYPSTGLMAIAVCRDCEAKKIDLYGFDFWDTPTYYNPKGYITKHNYENEKKIAHILASNKIITIN